MSTLTDDTQDSEALDGRLRRIEGQVRGLQRMVAADLDCIDILTQISAATHALEAVAFELIEQNLRHCVREAFESGAPDADAQIAEVALALRRLARF